MVIPNTTEQVIDQLARDSAASQRQSIIAEYDRNYRELEGDVFSSTDIQAYWPRRYKETPTAYKERTKIWSEMPRIICNRLTSVLLSGTPERKWVAISDAQEDIANAERATELEELSNEVNAWDSKANQVYYYALGIGELALWPEFRLFDTATGEPYELKSGGQGIPIWSQWFPWFVEPISLQDYAEEIIGAMKCVWLDGQMATPLLTQVMSGNAQSTLVEIYLSPRYDRLTGNKTSGGLFRRYKNGSRQKDDGLDEWWDENQYQCNPVVFFRGPDPDESQYRGKAFTARFRSLAIEHSRTISNIGQAVEVLPTIWRYTGEQKAINELSIRTNSIVQIPEGGTFEQAARELNLLEDWKLVNYLEKTISLLAVLPAEVWDMLGSAGKVESGVALKLTMQPMVESVNLIRKSFAASEHQKMRSTVKMFNYYNQDKQIDLKNIRPEVQYNREIIPIDEAVAIVNDLALLNSGAKSLVELVKKHNPSITTDEQAQAFIEETRKQKEPPRAIRFTTRRDEVNGQDR